MKGKGYNNKAKLFNIEQFNVKQFLFKQVKKQKMASLLQKTPGFLLLFNSLRENRRK